MSFIEVPTCGECIHANCYRPYWLFPYSEPKCGIIGKSVKPNDVACKFFNDGKNNETKCCKRCGLNISDLDDEEEFCEYCK